MSNAVVDQLADLVQSQIAGNWGPVAPNAVTVVDTIFEEIDSIQGVQIWIFATGEGTDEAASRIDFNRTITLGIVFFARYSNPGDPTQTWIRSQRALVEASILDVLLPYDFENRFTSVSGTGQTFWLSEISKAGYDPVLLAQKKIFWTDIELVFKGI